VIQIRGESTEPMDGGGRSDSGDKAGGTVALLSVKYPLEFEIIFTAALIGDY